MEIKFTDFRYKFKDFESKYKFEEHENLNIPESNSDEQEKIEDLKILVLIGPM